MENEMKLENCPFCSRLPILLNDKDRCYYECTGCNARTNETAPNQSIAVRYWNTRQPPAPWIAVGDGLPDEYGIYLVQTVPGNWYICRFFVDGDANVKWYDISSGNYFADTHIVAYQKIEPYNPKGAGEGDR